jgi:hypothetical protein
MTPRASRLPITVPGRLCAPSGLVPFVGPSWRGRRLSGALTFGGLTLTNGLATGGPGHSGTLGANGTQGVAGNPGANGNRLADPANLAVLLRR